MLPANDVGSGSQCLQPSARAVHEVATREGVEMPICEQVYKLLYENISVDDAIQALMQREVKAEA